MRGVGTGLQLWLGLKAAPLYVKACKGGDAESCVNLGILYQSGEGMPRDEAKPAELFDKACELGGEYKLIG